MSIRKITVSIAAAALVGAGAILTAPAAAQAEPGSCPEGVYATADGGLTVYGCVDSSRSVPLDGDGYWVAQPGTAVPVYSDTGQVGTATVTAASIEITSTADPGVPIWATIPAGVIICGTAPQPEPEPSTEPTAEPTVDPTAKPTADPTSTPTGDPEPSTAPTADATSPAAQPAEDTATSPAPVSGAPTLTPETDAPAPATADTPAGLPATGSGSTITAGLLVAGGVAVLGATAYALALGLCRAAALPTPTPDDQYAARRAAEQEDLS